MLFYVLFVLYRSMYCLCVNVYCHRVTTQLQLINISYHIMLNDLKEVIRQEICPIDRQFLAHVMDDFQKKA